jgi:acylphosphatase
MATHLLITGRVQGVGYRHSLRQQALRLGLAGWVRNRHDGSVEAVIDGAPEAMAQLLAWAHSGPPAARVDAVTATEMNTADSAAPGGFEMRATA